MEIRTRPPTQEQSAIVERVARIVSRVRGAKPDYARLAAELEPAIPFDVFGVVLLRHDRLAVRVTVCQREARSWVAQHHQHPLEGSKLEQFLPSPVTIVQNYPEGLDGPPALCGDALSNFHQLRSTLIAPLIVGEKVLGTLELGSNQHDTYADVTLRRLIDAVVHVLAAAIDSAQVGGSAEIQDRQREALKDVSSALTSTVDLATILDQIVIGIAKALNVASAIVTYDQRKGHLRLEAESGLNQATLRRMTVNNGGLSEQGIIGYTLRRRQPVFSNDISSDERFPLSRAFTTELGIRSVFSYPLVTGSTVYGALLLCSPEPGGFTPLKADILSLFASQATIAIHNGMLLEAARERRRFQETIEQLDAARQQSGSAGSSELDDLVVLKRVREESERTFGVSFSSLLRFISDHLLTSSERDLQDILHAIPDEQNVKDINVNSVNGTVISVLQEERTATFVETAEAALAGVGLLGDVSAALTPVITQLYERVTSDMTTPWFVTDQQGKCIYVNPAAEVFCGIRLSLDNLGNLASLHRPAHEVEQVSLKVKAHDIQWPLESQVHFDTYMPFSQTMISQTSSLTLLDAFAGLLPRIRNANEVQMYLQEFTYSDLDPDDAGSVERKQNVAQLEFPSANTLRCVLAAEPVQRLPPQQFQVDAKGPGEKEPVSFHVRSAKKPGNRFTDPQTLLPDRAPSDRHYQFMRFAFYDSQGQLLASALQIQDISGQVRDEKNKSVLLSTVSHDLRTPLTTIKAAVTGLLQPDVTWDEQMLREVLDDIDIEADHLYALINSFIEMSRIDMGALVLEKEWCDFVEIVHSTLDLDERLLAGHPARTHFQPQLPMVYVDYVQLKRVLSCLLENAVHHSPENAEIVIAIDTVAGREQDVVLSKDSHRFLRVRVIDHGTGVPEGEQERIFKTFYSLDSQGSGLGLAISRGIIEAHQGRIRVEPALGGGSCFAFVLPISL